MLSTVRLTGVVTVRFHRIQAEFHASQDASLHPGAARIHHCLLRLRNVVDAHGWTDTLETIGRVLHELAYLETVVLETGSQTKTGVIQPLLESLHKASGVEVQHRTHESAHKLALQAGKDPSCPTGAGLLSPFWYLKEHASRWAPSGRYHW